MLCIALALALAPLVLVLVFVVPAGSSSLSLVVEWVSSPLADMVADSVVGVVLQVRY